MPESQGWGGITSLLTTRQLAELGSASGIAKSRRLASRLEPSELQEWRNREPEVDAYVLQDDPCVGSKTRPFLGCTNAKRLVQEDDEKTSCSYHRLAKETRLEKTKKEQHSAIEASF